MPDYGIEFRDLGRCVEFIELALRNRRALGIERENIDRIFVTDKRYTVFLTDAQEQIDLLLRKLIKAKTIQQIQDGEPPGEELTINRLLERVRLVAQPQPQIDAGVAVVLHDAADKDFRSRYSEILSMGCRDLRVGIVQPTDENYRITHIILVDRPPKRFSTPGYWIQSTSGWGSRAVAFCRCFVNEDFPLYVEMGYEHPVPGLDRLYNISAERAKGIFVYGKDPTEERMVGNQEENNSPHWIIVGRTEGDEIFSIPDESLSLEPARAAPRRFLKPRESDQQDSDVLQLRVQRDTRRFSTTESIEGQLAWHQQAVEELQREHRESRALRRDSVYLAYEFHPAFERRKRIGADLELELQPASGSALQPIEPFPLRIFYAPHRQGNGTARRHRRAP